MCSVTSEMPFDCLGFFPADPSVHFFLKISLFLYLSVCKHYSLIAPTIHSTPYHKDVLNLFGQTHKNLTAEKVKTSLSVIYKLVSFLLFLSSRPARCLGGHICQSNKQQTVELAPCDASAPLGCLHVWLRHQTCPSGLPVRPLSP